MVSHHTVKIGHRHCGQKDVMFLVAEEQYFRCSL